jgi:hypothetical protein
MSGRPIPPVTSAVTEDTLTFCAGVIEDSGVAQRFETLLVRRTGRRPVLPVNALLVALLVLALDDRPLHLKAATRLLFCGLPEPWRRRLGVVGAATTRKSFLARYRCVRYLFHLVVSVMDPSVEVKNRVIDQAGLDAMRKELTEAEIALRRARLESVLASLLEASVRVHRRRAGRLRRIGRPRRHRGPALQPPPLGAHRALGGGSRRRLVCARGRPPRGHRPQGTLPAQAVLGDRGHHRDHGASGGIGARPSQPGPGAVPHPAR